MKIKSNLRTFFQVQIQHLCGSLQVVKVLSVLTCIQIYMFTLKKPEVIDNKKKIYTVASYSICSFNKQCKDLFSLAFVINCTSR